MMTLLAMEKFCNSTFWDLNLTWNTDFPQLTSCFQKTVLVWIPCFFLWIFSSFDVYFSLTSKARDIPWNWRNLGKLIIVVLLISICSFDFFYYYSMKNKVAWVDILTPIIKLETLMLCGVLIFSHVRHGQRSSGVLFLFWFLLIFLGVPQFQGELNVILNGGKEPTHFSFIILYLLSCCIFILSFFSDLPPSLTEHPPVENPSPEEAASFPSCLFFAWFDRMAYLGFKKPLTNSDLWSLSYIDQASHLYHRFSRYWNDSVRKNTKISIDQSSQFRHPPSSDGIDGIGRAQTKPTNVLPVLCRVFGPAFIFASFFQLIQDALIFANPQLLRIIINYVNSDEPHWRGFLYASLLFLIANLQTLFNSYYINTMNVIGLRVRTSLITAIYRKALRLSNSARQQTTVGEIVNLMSVDAQRVMGFVSYLNMLWSTPLQIGLALYFLWDTLGPSVFAGFAVLVVSLFFNFLISNKEKHFTVTEMENKDERVKMMNEILSGIKVLKLYAWEPSFEDEVLKIRNKETNVLKKMVYLSSASIFLVTCAPFLVSLVTFAVYVLSDKNHILDAPKAFLALSLFNILRSPLYFLPAILVYGTETWVSLKRINKFMNHEEIDPDAISHDEHEDDPLIIENGTFSWGKDGDTVLHDITLKVKQGTLVAIVGSVGSGKSSLISSLLGEMDKKAGRVNVKGSVAYATQLAWIQNATLRDNILFGKAMNSAHYQRVIEACALKPDLEMLPGDDLTEIGEKGINLSGGQKQRVSVARAIYADSDIYFLDDPLSAVDSHVGKHIFESVISSKGILQKKTRIFVTHNISYLPDVDQIVVLKDGTISEVGTYKELLEKKGAFSEFITAYSQEVDGNFKELDSSAEKPSTYRQLSRQKSVTSDTSSSSLSKRRASVLSQQEREDITKNEKLIEEENAEVGQVKWKVYDYYLRSIGLGVSVATIIVSILFQALSVGTNFWLSVWSSANTSAMNSETIMMYIEVYGLLGFVQSIFSFLNDIVPRLGCWTAAVKLHKHLLRSILRAPLSFMDTTPIGRIISRFSNDVDRLDNSLQFEICSGIYCFFETLGILFVISYSAPIFMALILPIGVIYYLIQRFYVPTSRQLKRLESVSRSPIYSHFSESISGSSIIRAFNLQESFITDSEEKLDSNVACLYPGLIAQRWLAIRLEMIGNLIIFFAALFAVLEKDSISPGLVGLSVSYSLEITQALNWLVRMTVDIETNLVSVERIKEYIESPQEAPWEINPNPAHDDWPDRGQVTFAEYKVRYREGLDLVLKGISCNINSGEKVGIVGRTGAGKSSLTLSLFRIIEAAEGNILIDGIDISKLGLHSLRSRLTIIPQDPVIFSGCLRLNLDPLSQYADEQIWRALELAHLKAFVTGLTAGLQYELSEGGENLSVGQRQLICLARALLRKTKILVLDEATAAVDLETDDLVQKTIRSEFKDCTVITIAHRLNTIMDSDRVLVLDKGIIVEYDPPSELLKCKNSIFYRMARDAGLV